MRQSFTTTVAKNCEVKVSKNILKWRSKKLDILRRSSEGTVEKVDTTLSAPTIYPNPPRFTGGANIVVDVCV